MTYVSRSCCLRRWRSVLRVKLPSWQPTFGDAPNWYFVPFLSRIL